MEEISLIDKVIADIPKVGIEASEEYADELKYVCDSRVILDELRGYEVKIPKHYIDEYEQVFGNGVLQYMQELTGVKYDNFDGANTYNWNGRIMHDFDYRTYEMEDNTYYVAIQVHRGGDVRGNYTDFVLFKFDNPEHWFEVVEDITIYSCGGSRVVDGKEYVYDLSIFSEYIHIWCNETQRDFDIYAYNDESFDEEIRKAEKELAEN